jgi:hypothetical protein
MSDLAFLANEHFHSLPVEKQRDILWQYVLYVQKVVISETGDPFLFLKWYLLTEPFETEEQPKGDQDE